MKNLYVVATPIGNLEDITIRAIKILFEVKIIACEDTRRTGMLIKILHERYSSVIKIDFHQKQYISVRDWNESEQVEKVLLFLNNYDVAIVSDAGTPLLSDPGFKLVRAVIEKGGKVVPIPGPSAITAALSAAGLPTEKFKFWGFLKKGLVPDLETGVTHVIFESPERIGDLIASLKDKYKEAEAVAGLEITKVHERFLRGVDIKELIDSKVKGEVVLMVRLNS